MRLSNQDLASYPTRVAGSTEGERMLARDALRNISQRLLETGKPVAMKVARRVWEGAVGKGLASVSTSLAAYFISENGKAIYMVKPGRACSKGEGGTRDAESHNSCTG